MRKISLAAFLLSMVLAAPAWAHAWRASAGAGIAIPSIAHGQMAVIAKNRTAILELAEQQSPTDLTMRRLQSYVNLQFFACMWGLAHGIDDEASPFNECSHAYLAATRTLLEYLQTMPGDRTRVNALVAKIEDEIAHQDRWQVICEYSATAFNTDEVIWPPWGHILTRPLNLMALAGAMLAIFGARLIALRKRREEKTETVDSLR